MDTNSIPLPIQIRLHVLEALLDGYGYINREILADIHGLKIATVSLDISLYKKLNKESCFYNRSSRRIEKLSTFKRVFAKASGGGE